MTRLLRGLLLASALLGGVILAAPAARATDTWNIINATYSTFTATQIAPIGLPNTYASIASSPNIPACVSAGVVCASTLFPTMNPPGPGSWSSPTGWMQTAWEGPPDTPWLTIDYYVDFTANDSSNPGTVSIQLQDPLAGASSGNCYVTGNYGCTVSPPINSLSSIFFFAAPASPTAAAVGIGSTQAEVTPSGGALIPVSVTSKGLKKVLEHATLMTLNRSTVVGEVEQVVRVGGTQYLEVHLSGKLASRVNSGHDVTVWAQVKHADGTPGPQVEGRRIRLTRLVPHSRADAYAVTARMMHRTGGIRP